MSILPLLILECMCPRRVLVSSYVAAVNVNVVTGPQTRPRRPVFSLAWQEPQRRAGQIARVRRLIGSDHRI